MSLHNEFVIGTAQAATAYAAGTATDGIRSHAFGGFTDLDIGLLYAILCGEEFSFDRHELLPVEGGCPVETLFPLPDAFVRAAAEADDKTLLDTAEQWAAEDEINATAAELLPVLRQLRQAAHELQTGEQLYFLVRC